MSAAKPVARAAVLLQAAVAEAALGEWELAGSRVEGILRVDREALLPLANATADFVDGLTLIEGAAWATGTPSADGEDPVDLDERVPRARALTLRLMSAWSSEDPDLFDALYRAAASDPQGAEDLGDLYTYALGWVEQKAPAIANPQVYVGLLCKAIRDHGPTSFAWTRTPKKR